MKKIPQLPDLESDRADDAAAGEAASADVTPPDLSPAEIPPSEIAPGTVPTEDVSILPPGALDPAPVADARAEGAAGRKASRPGPRKGGGGQRKPGRGPARRFARERALQALYQWDLADAESSTVRHEFVRHQDMSRVDVEYFERLFRGVSHDVEKVDGSLGEALDRPIVELDPIERAVLRIAAFELAEVLETPARVIINEGVEITKRFGADNGHRYVNGVLDGLAATLRPLEMRRG